MDLLLEFRRFEVKRRRFSPLGEAKWRVRKRTRGRRKSNYESSEKKRMEDGGNRKKGMRRRIARGRARICQRRKPVRYGPSTRIEWSTRNFPILKADTPSDRWKRRRKKKEKPTRRIVGWWIDAESKLSIPLDILNYKTSLNQIDCEIYPSVRQIR